jgi:effector-binding domain-containing protein
MTNDAIQMEEVGPQPIVGIRAKVPTEGLAGFFEVAWRELLAHAAGAGARVMGPAMSLWHSAPGDVPGGFDMEVCIPVDRVLAVSSRVVGRELPRGTLASTLHEGPYATMVAAFDAVWKSTQANGYAMAGPPRDVVLVGPKDTDRLRRNTEHKLFTRCGGPVN